MSKEKDTKTKAKPQNLENEDTLKKYTAAAGIATRALEKVIAASTDGASVLQLCKLGDDSILAETSAVFTKKVDGKILDKGIAFPTSVSVNNVICNFSPLHSDPDVRLKNGDVVKIDLGAHIDGFIGVIASTVVVGNSEAAPVSGRQADVILAAHAATEAAIRAIQPGGKSADITALIQKVAEEYKCTAVEGMQSHQIHQNVISGEKAIIQNPSEAQKKEHKNVTFEVNEAYAVDIIITSGEAKPRVSEQRSTIYKKTNTRYELKMKTSRAFFAEINKKFSDMPFTLRACEDEKKARLGVSECVAHSVLETFSVFLGRDGDFVAQFKTVVLLHPGGAFRLTGDTLNPALYKSEFSVKDESIKAILARPLTTQAPEKKEAPAAAVPVAAPTTPAE